MDLFKVTRLNRDIKLKQTFETTLLQHVGGVEKQYILVLGSFAPSPRCLTQYENIFFLTTSQYVKSP